MSLSERSWSELELLLEKLKKASEGESSFLQTAAAQMSADDFRFQTQFQSFVDVPLK